MSDNSESGAVGASRPIAALRSAVEALREIASWRGTTLGKPEDYPRTEHNVSFQVGLDMAFHRCAQRAEEVLPELAAVLASSPPETESADDYCATCGETLARHYTPCRVTPEPAAVLRLLERLLDEGKRPAAIRVLARHLHDVPDDGQRVVQSEAVGLASSPPPGSGWQPIETAKNRR